MPGFVFRAAMTAYAARYWLPVDASRRAAPSARRSAYCATSSPPIAATQFGVGYRFADIVTPEDFRRAVPVQDYETLRDYIERQRCTGVAGADGGAAALLRADERFDRHAQVHSGLRLGAPHASRGTGAIHLPAVPRVPRRVFRQGAGHHGRRRRGPARLRSRRRFGVGLPVPSRCRPLCSPGSCVPPGVSAIADYDLKYLTILRLALASPDITLPGLAESVDVSAAARSAERAARRAGAFPRNRDRFRRSTVSTTPRGRS